MKLEGATFCLFDVILQTFSEVWENHFYYEGTSKKKKKCMITFNNWILELRPYRRNSTSVR